MFLYRDNARAQNRHRLSIAAVMAAAATLLSIPVTSHGQFNLNWQATESGYLNNDARVTCDFTFMSDSNCSTGGFGGDFDLSGSHKDGTAFFQRQFDSGGQRYFHVIIGDYTQDDFLQEVFIRASSGNPSFNSGGGGWGGDAIRASDSVANMSSQANEVFNMTQPYSADATRTGMGSANPNRVIMRQVNTDGIIVMDFVKDAFSQKPLIVQEINTTEMDSLVSMDMRNLNYSELTPIAAEHFISTTTHKGDDVPENVTIDFDWHTTGSPENRNQNVGAFIYVEGSGSGGSGGTYQYLDPLDDTHPFFNPFAFDHDWVSFCDPGQNPNWGNGSCAGGSSGGSSWGGGAGGWR